jgi:hypothetical protein
MKCNFCCTSCCCCSIYCNCCCTFSCIIFSVKKNLYICVREPASIARRASYYVDVRGFRSLMTRNTTQNYDGQVRFKGSLNDTRNSEQFLINDLVKVHSSQFTEFCARADLALNARATDYSAAERYLCIRVMVSLDSLTARSERAPECAFFPKKGDGATNQPRQ